MQSFCFSCLYVFILPLSQAYNTNESHNTSTDEVLVAMTHASANSSRFRELRDALSSMYDIAPKNEHGFLSHQAVRYVLHRFFQQQNGWLIKGLALNETQSWHSRSSATTDAPKIKDWVPSFLQDQLEQGSMQQKGTDLAGLVQLAGALEELVESESRDRLKMAYAMHDWPVGRLLNHSESHTLLRTFFITFLVAGNFGWQDVSEVVRKEGIFAKRYPDYPEIMRWMEELVEEHRLRHGETEFGTFESLLQIALQIEKQYHLNNDRSCQGMKHTLMELESKKAGRVRLSTFYNKSIYSTFKFVEKAEYLKTLGVLDDSDPQNPQVIIPNYIMARTNCLEASSIFAVCCRDQCENLLTKVESQFQSSLAEPQKIVELVSRLSTDTVDAPRVLGHDLIARLEQVAAQNHGQVPLHGRLFAQWMHHAFPRECPYPHQSGSAIPLTQEEWESSKQSDAMASMKEMQETVESAVCEIDGQGKVKGICEEDESLPWSDEEELLGVQVMSHSRSAAAPHTMQRLERIAAPLSVATSLIAVCALYWDYSRAKLHSGGNKQDVLYVDRVSQRDMEQKFADFQKTLGLWVLAMVVWALEIPDTSVVGWTICGYMVVLAGRALKNRMTSTYQDVY
eukprot:TRINITY_DN103260_c0_g1_i1.p1 TRINITY_DN103260_c0_g1~~TRINITY_DN103260_c0_g1_i1.p1  ORF type:complete len:624 (+),score=120.96 TRINITY_DN103260_c0_g1_i1:115-1986(+)